MMENLETSLSIGRISKLDTLFLSLFVHKRQFLLDDLG